MTSEAVVEIVHLRLHTPTLARLATPDLPASFLDTWHQICSSASNAGGHCFRLFRSASDLANFYFIGGWNDPAVHAKIISRTKDTLLAARLGTWMEHVSVQHVKADVVILDKIGNESGLRAVIKEWKVELEEEETTARTEDTDRCTAGWDVSEEVQSQVKEFRDMASILKGGEGAFKLNVGKVEKDAKTWVAVEFCPEVSEQVKQYSTYGNAQVLDLVLGARPLHLDESRVTPSEQA